MTRRILDEFSAPVPAAERARRYRARQAAAGIKPVSPGGRAAPSAWQAGEFVAIDGEGFSEGAQMEIEVGANRQVYTGQKHYYALLQASDGSELYNPDGRLSAWECLDFLVDIRLRNPLAIVVVFGGGYDFTHMLAHDLTPEQLYALTHEPEEGGARRRARPYLDVSHGAYDYRLEYRPRKTLSIWRWARGERRCDQDKRGRWRMRPSERVTVWDTFGFWQAPFSQVMKTMIPDDKDAAWIDAMKQRRGEAALWVRSEIDEIRAYNRAECRCLVRIMYALRDAVDMLGLKLRRWDGAGAIAQAMLGKHGVKAHKGDLPAEVFTASRCAYSGGHIETFQVGFRDGPIYHYDISSAYPSWFARCPSLAHGRWVHRRARIPQSGFCLYRLRYHFRDGCSFYPLFHRDDQGAILYPPKGSGWYWQPEYEAAKAFAEQFGAHIFEVTDCWEFCPSPGVASPFSWVADYYEERKAMVAHVKSTGRPDGREQVIKFALNGLIGKCSQQVGAQIDEEGGVTPPPYFQLAWAGFVTSGCRAQLMGAMMQNMPAIIAVATDGVFSTEPLDLPCPAEKILGAWEFKRHAGMTTVMPGVYWLHDDDAMRVRRASVFARGFSRSAMADPDFIHAAWRRHRESVRINIRRLVGIGSALVSADMWAMRGQFMDSKRELKINGDTGKRYPAMLYRHRADLGLVPTLPRELPFSGDVDCDDLMSQPYPIAWIVDEERQVDDDVSPLEEEREMLDAELIS
jgi:hypothetical protein